MAVAEATAPVELCQVEALGFEHHGPCPGGQNGAPLGDQALDLGSDLVDTAAHHLALVGLHAAQLAAHGRQHRPLPQQLGIDRREGVEVRSVRNSGSSSGEVCVEIQVHQRQSAVSTVDARLGQTTTPEDDHSGAAGKSVV